MAYTLNNIRHQLQEFWLNNQCIYVPSCDIKKGAATLNLNIIIEVLKATKNIFTFENCYRYDDNLNNKLSNNQGTRVVTHTQLEVLLNQYEDYHEVLEKFIQSLEYISISRNSISLGSDNWKHLFLKAKGIGWEAKIDGLEIAQLTFFDSIGNINLPHRPFEIAYGLERIACVIQNKLNIQDIQVSEQYTYHDIYATREDNNRFGLLDNVLTYSNLKTLENNMNFYLKRQNYYLAAESLIEISNTINMLNIPYEEYLNIIYSFSESINNIFFHLNRIK